MKEENNNNISRRTALKSFAGIPVAGLFGVELFRKINYDKDSKGRISKELGLDQMNFTVPEYGNKSKGEHIRVGIIGIGRRAEQLTAALGFMHPDEVERRRKNKTFRFFFP